jgi:hypothetical protein
MSGLFCGPHNLADKALRARKATPMIANAAGTDANFIVALLHDVSPLTREDRRRSMR